MAATPRRIAASGIGHHQCSQRAAKPWPLSRPVQKAPSTTSAAPSNRPTRFTATAYPANQHILGHPRSSRLTDPQEKLRLAPTQEDQSRARRARVAQARAASVGRERTSRAQPEAAAMERLT